MVSYIVISPDREVFFSLTGGYLPLSACKPKGRYTPRKWKTRRGAERFIDGIVNWGEWNHESLAIRQWNLTDGVTE